MNEILDTAGFLMSGIGSLGFFFIYTFISGITRITDAFGNDLCQSGEIKDFWLTTDRRKKFAFWCVSEGSTICFIVVAAGFLFQLWAKL